MLQKLYSYRIIAKGFNFSQFNSLLSLSFGKIQGYQNMYPLIFASFIPGLVQTLDEQISRQHARIDSIFPEFKLKNDVFS